MRAAAWLLPLLLGSSASAELVVDPRAQPDADLALVEFSPASAPPRAKAKRAKRRRHRAKAKASMQAKSAPARRPLLRRVQLAGENARPSRVQWLYVSEPPAEDPAKPGPAAAAAAISASLDVRELQSSAAPGPGVARDTVRESGWKSLREE